MANTWEADAMICWYDIVVQVPRYKRAVSMKDWKDGFQHVVFSVSPDIWEMSKTDLCVFVYVLVSQLGWDHELMHEMVCLDSRRRRNEMYEVSAGIQACTQLFERHIDLEHVSHTAKLVYFITRSLGVNMKYVQMLIRPISDARVLLSDYQSEMVKVLSYRIFKLVQRRRKYKLRVFMRGIPQIEYKYDICGLFEIGIRKLICAYVQG